MYWLRSNGVQRYSSNGEHWSSQRASSWYTGAEKEAAGSQVRVFCQETVTAALGVCAVANCGCTDTVTIKVYVDETKEQLLGGASCKLVTPHDWLQNFRMTHATFLYLCNELRSSIERSDTVIRRAIPVEQRLALALWFLSTNADYRTIGYLFGVS